MSASNVAITVEFLKTTDSGNSDDNNGENPATTTEYTVSVVSGIKGGRIEVSLDNAYELPDGEIYVLFPNLKDNGKGTICVS